MTILYDDAVSSESSVVSVRAYGALANGSDDSVAVQNALITALSTNKPLYFPPGTYTLSGWVAPSISGSLVVKGDNATITNTFNSTDFIQLSGGASLSIEGLTFTNWKFGVFTHNNIAGSQINHIRLNKCSFTNVVCGIATATTSSAVGAVNIGEVRVDSCYFNNIGRASIDLNSSGLITNVWITNNDISNVSANQLSGRKHGINVQGGYQTINGTYSTTRFISNNRISGVSNNTTDDCLGIGAEGYFCHVSNNHLRDVTKVSGESSNNDGIYVKSAYSIIEGNTLFNCAQSQGAINVKGINRGESAENFGYASIVTHNNIVNTDASGRLRHCGIDVFTEDSLITNNIIEGVSFGIRFETTATDSVAKNNIIRRLDAPSGSIVGVQIGAGGVTCTNNQFEDLGVSGVTTLQVRAIFLTATTTLDGLDVSNNKIMNLHSTTVNARRAIYCSLGATGNFINARIDNNYIKGADTGIRITAVNQMSGLTMTMNKFESVATPVLYDAGSPTANSSIYLNRGATSSFQVSGSKGSNAALTSLLTHLNTIGLIDNQST